MQLILLVVAFSYLPCLEGSSPPSCTCFGSFQPATSFCFSSQLLKHPPPFLCLDFTAPWPFLFGMFSVMLFHSQLKISSFFSFQMSVFLKMHVFLGILFFCTILSDFEPTNFSACTPPTLTCCTLLCFYYSGNIYMAAWPILGPFSPFFNFIPIPHIVHVSTI